MSHDTEGAIAVLQEGLKPERPHTFAQADGLVCTIQLSPSSRTENLCLDQIIFELAWTLLSQRRYEEAAETFIKMTEINSWCVLIFTFLTVNFQLHAANSHGAWNL